MSTVPKRTNVKLAKLFYKYADSIPKEEVKEEKEPEEEKNQYESYPPYNFSWFVQGKIAAMGWPQTVENLNYLVDAGINHLITLSPEKLPPIYDFDRKLKWTEIGIKEFGAPTLKQIIKFIEICERAQINGVVIGVHCRHGRGRTGTMLACYLVHFQNMAPERAVLTVRVQRPGSCETYEQEKIVCYYHDCVRGTVAKPDYRLVDDKVYFDCSMKYVYPDEDNHIKEVGADIIKEVEAHDKAIMIDDELSKLQSLSMEERIEEIKARSCRKSKAMVINHKIYF